MIDIENHILADVDYGGRGANLAVTLWIDEKAHKAHLLCETETSFSNLPKPPQGAPVFSVTALLQSAFHFSQLSIDVLCELLQDILNSWHVGAANVAAKCQIAEKMEDIGLDRHNILGYKPASHGA